uniref:Uncharacterized protein n=1 Tax=Glossina palpalis gambiensis TaxID=67801 RepID=A0A1B0AST9_9MUSC
MMFIVYKKGGGRAVFILCLWRNVQFGWMLDAGRWMIGLKFEHSDARDIGANNNWQTNFASINKSNENSPQTSKKQRDCGETARDSLAYSCLLKNELLGTAIEDVKAVSDERNENTYTPTTKRSLFKYQSPTKQFC